MTIAVVGGGGVWWNIPMGGDVNPNGYGGFKTTIWLYQDNVAATQTAVALLIQGDAARQGNPVPYTGSIIGIVVVSNEARTAGTLTVDATVAGTVTGLQAVLDGTNTTVKATTQAKDLDTFTAGQLIGCKITTTGTWTPITADIIVGVTIEY